MRLETRTLYSFRCYEPHKRLRRAQRACEPGSPTRGFCALGWKERSGASGPRERRAGVRGRAPFKLRTALGLSLLLVHASDRPAQATVRQVPAPAIDVGFEPSPMGVADKMLELAGVKANDVVYDLGSG